jgi:hypothetical protein
LGFTVPQMAAAKVRCNPKGLANVFACLFGVIRATLTARRSLPVFPDKQTFSTSVGMSQRCQYRKSTTYSITSSAATSKAFGMARPSALAVLKLTTRSNLVGCNTGNAAGIVPARILPV